MKKPPTKQGTKPNISKPKTKTNTKNHPLKVVYISTPMKVTTSASSFRALVQRLTGKGAVWPVDPSDLEPHTDPISPDVGVTMKDAADLSPDTSAASNELYLQPFDQEGYMPAFNDHDLACLLESDGVDFFDRVLV